MLKKRSYVLRVWLMGGIYFVFAILDRFFDAEIFLCCSDHLDEATMKNNNGWVQSIDPTTGRVFYANKHTRTTQWEVPEGWHEQQHNEPSCQQQQHSTNTIDTLPDGWEESIDPKTGRTFYINHLERVTTWDRPTASPVPNTSASRPGHDATTPFGEGDYSSLNTITLNRFGSHSKWTDPSKGSRYSNSNATWSSKNKSSEPPQLEFSTVHVPDLLRSQCPQCNAFFTTLKRRHHCRLCGDIFCDACSQGRAVLPLDGDEFDKSVRVCDCCLKDVKRYVSNRFGNGLSTNSVCHSINSIYS